MTINTLKFWSQVDKTDSCWIWTGYRNTDGYGKHRQKGVHRLAYTMLVGQIPFGLCVLHRCDNPPCVNPKHLFVGTHSENMQDMVSKKRHHAQKYGNPSGEMAFNHKLCASDVLKIRDLKDKHSYSELGKMFGVRKETAFMAATKRTWKHL